MTMKRIQKGFSLVELMVVIAIIAIVAAISLASLSAVQKNSRDIQRQADLHIIQGALQQYYADKNRYPNELPSLTTGGAITNCSGTTTSGCTISKTYISKTPRDPSGTAYHYLPYTDTTSNPCTFSGGVENLMCHKYVLCTKLEAPVTGNSCSHNGSYNYQIKYP